MEPFNDNEDEDFVLNDEVVVVDEERTTSRYVRQAACTLQGSRDPREDLR
jgi:hypothetical protein